MARRHALPADYLDSLMTPAAKPTNVGKGPQRVKQQEQPKGPRLSGSVRATFHLPAALVDEAKNAVVALSGPPWRMTLTQLATEAIRREVDRLRKTDHGGKPFPPRGGELRTGRPLKD